MNSSILHQVRAYHIVEEPEIEGHEQPEYLVCAFSEASALAFAKKSNYGNLRDPEIGMGDIADPDQFAEFLEEFGLEPAEAIAEMTRLSSKVRSPSR